MRRLVVSVFVIMMIIGIVSAQGGLVAYYPFNGNANDESGNGNDGSVIGPSLTSDRFGNVNSAYSFDGIDDWIASPSLDSFNGTNFSFSTWFVIVEDLERGQVLFDNQAAGVGAGGGGVVSQLGASAFDSRDGRAPAHTLSQNSFLNLDEWHFLTFTANSNDLKLYFDGELIEDEAFQESPSSVREAFGIGASPHLTAGVQNFLSGKIDDFSIYNRVLNPSEIDSLYHLGGWPVSNAGAQLIIDSPDGIRLILPADNAPVDANFELGNVGDIDVEYSVEIVSSDSTWLLYMDEPDPSVSFNGNIWKMRPDGSEQVQLTFDIADREAVWSPDGSQIAFQSIRDGIADVWIMNSDGTGLANLTNQPDQFNAWPSWSPDGEWIIFGSTRDTSPTEIYRINVFSTNVERLTNNDVLDSRPIYSPDGNYFVTQSRDLENEWHIRVYTQDGASFSEFGTEGQADYQPSWTPRGDRVVWSSYLNGTSLDVLSTALDGSDRRVELQTGFNHFYPRLSPDGQYLATPTNNEILVFHKAFNKVHVLSDDNPLDADWGPDWQKQLGMPTWVSADQATGQIAVGGQNQINITLDVNLLPPGDHTASIMIKSTGNEQVLAIYPINIRISDHLESQIVSIEDVPNDQGGWVEVNWIASPFDGLGGITQYGIWERNPSGDWVALGNVPALQRSWYTFLAHTYEDMVDGQPYWSEFFITAHTQNPEEFYSSEVGFGYSIDNIDPAIPGGLLGELSDDWTVHLSWESPTDEDFRVFRIYRDASPDFVPSELSLISEIDLPEYDDELTVDGEYWYRVSAVDIHGNESEASSALNVLVVSIETALLPTEYVLHQNYPNPFNPTTTIHYGLPEESHVSLVIYDVRGIQIQALKSGHQSAGWYDVVWNGETADGKTISTGIYFARLVAGDYSQVVKMLFLK
ncbi:MAG: PD40 domain-containing protein [Candidatus Marinimicrobia bacterium]|nr:PD40 domain-containing protein [Candidatus Neomarinimicrobiota bacterium]